MTCDVPYWKRIIITALLAHRLVRLHIKVYAVIFCFFLIFPFFLFVKFYRTLLRSIVMSREAIGSDLFLQQVPLRCVLRTKAVTG